jgi:hypothetical protein
MQIKTRRVLALAADNQQGSENKELPAPLADSVLIPPEEVCDDIITAAIQNDEVPDVVLKGVLLGMAEEQRALRDIRVKKTKENKETSQYSTKRGTLLKYMSDALIQRQALVSTAGELDIKGPKFREIIKLFLTMIRETFEELKIPTEYRDQFFVALGRNLEGWESKVEKILKVMH